MVRTLCLDAIRAETKRRSDPEPDRRQELLGQLERLQDLYIMGDLPKSQYVMRRQALEEELERVGPRQDPGLAQADLLLRDFARFWKTEPNPAERRKLLASLIDRVWQDSGTTIAVQPREPFARYFAETSDTRRAPKSAAGVKSGSDGTRTRDLCRDRAAL